MAVSNESSGRRTRRDDVVSTALLMEESVYESAKRSMAEQHCEDKTSARADSLRT